MNFFDTSVLVAGVLKNHPRHAECFRLTSAMTSANSCIGVHSLAEMYASLTSLPGVHRIEPVVALALVEDTRSAVRTILLTADEYMKSIAAIAPNGLSGGIAYDALLMAVARKSTAKKIYTLNPRHFKLVAPELSSRIVEP